MPDAAEPAWGQPPDGDDFIDPDEALLPPRDDSSSASSGGQGFIPTVGGLRALLAAAHEESFGEFGQERQALMALASGPASDAQPLDGTSFGMLRLILVNILGLPFQNAAAAQSVIDTWMGSRAALRDLLEILIETLFEARLFCVCDSAGTWIPVGLFGWLTPAHRQRAGIGFQTRWMLHPEWPMPVHQVLAPSLTLTSIPIPGGELRGPLVSESLVGLRRATGAMAERWSHAAQTLQEIDIITSWDRLVGSSLLLHRAARPQTGWEELAFRLGVPHQRGWSGAAFSQLIARGEVATTPANFAWLTAPFEDLDA
jgi:hypothetical protein